MSDWLDGTWIRLRRILPYPLLRFNSFCNISILPNCCRYISRQFRLKFFFFVKNKPSLRYSRKPLSLFEERGLQQSEGWEIFNGDWLKYLENILYTLHPQMKWPIQCCLSTYLPPLLQKKRKENFRHIFYQSQFFFIQLISEQIEWSNDAYNFVFVSRSIERSHLIDPK